MKNLCQSITLGIAMLAMGTSAMAAGAPVGNQFSSGATISSTDVNSNFQELADRIDAAQNADIVDFFNYTNSGTANWAREGLNPDGTQRNQLSETIIVSNVQPDNTQTVTFEIRRPGPILTYRSIDTYEITTEGTILLESIITTYDDAGVIISDYTDVPDTEYLMRPRYMRLGDTYVNGTTFTRSRAVWGGVPINDVVTVASTRKYVMSHRTPSFNGHNDCIVIMRSEYGNRMGYHERSRVRCAGVGVVAEIRSFENRNVDLRELVP